MQLPLSSTRDAELTTLRGVDGGWPASATTPAASIGGRSAAPGSRVAIVVLQLFAFSVMVFPSNSVIRAIGAEGFLAALIGLFAFVLLIACTLLGFHKPVERRHPTRAGFVALWLVSLISYVGMHRHEVTTTVSLSGDRWLMQLAVVTGVGMLAAECMRSIDDIKRVLRAAVWGGAVCGFVAGMQFWRHTDLSGYLRMLPGFTVDAASLASGTRGSLSRVTGTAVHPIELGVTAGMLVPLAIWLFMFDGEKPAWKRFLPLPFLLISVSASVSRSAIIAIVLSVGVLWILLPARQRVTGLCVAPIAIAGVFLTSHGLLRTLYSYFAAGTSDGSVAHRVDNYPMVEQLVRQAPWFGTGGGSFLPPNLGQVLDNQYLTSAIEIGLVGTAVLAFYFILPFFTALSARRRSADPELRALSAALAGSALAATICSGTFDSFSFPQFVGIQALTAGLAGACWLLASRSTPLTGRTGALFALGGRDQLMQLARSHGRTL